MKKILESFNKLTPESVDEIKSILGLKKAGEKTIISRLLTISGVEALISSLSPEEQRLMDAVYKSPAGVTFTEIEKDTGISSQIIEVLADSLSAKALLYVLKNRQLLNNKLDKIYGIREFADIIKPADDYDIIENLSLIKDKLLDSSLPSEKKERSFSEKEASILKYIAESGYIASFENLKENFGNCDQLLMSLSEKGFIAIYFNFKNGFRIYAAIRHNKAMQIISALQEQKKFSVNNRFMFVNNMLYGADIISGYGLFLTQQQEFRKIDMRRVVDSLVLLMDSSGSPADGEKITVLTLAALNMLGCLEIKRDAVSINLKPLKSDIYRPENIIAKILKRLELVVPDEQPEAITFDVPDSESIESLISLAESNPGLPVAVMNTVALMRHMVDHPDELSASVKEGEKRRDSLKRAQDILCFLGIIRIEDGCIYLNESHFTSDGKSDDDKSVKNEQAVYVSPDFSVIIPGDEILPLSLYIMLCYLEIEKFDVIIHSRITKDSIVNAHKRGMPVQLFLDTLKKCSKSDLPQNMDFLLNEWIHQIIEIDITNRYLLKTNHPSFIDELTYSRAGSGVIERISDNYIIIDREHLDEIIKFARKKDVMLSLFKTGEADEA